MRPRARLVAYTMLAVAVVLIAVSLFVVENGFVPAMVGAFLAMMATMIFTIGANRREE